MIFYLSACSHKEIKCHKNWPTTRKPRYVCHSLSDAIQKACVWGCTSDVRRWAVTLWMFGRMAFSGEASVLHGSQSTLCEVFIACGLQLQQLFQLSSFSAARGHLFEHFLSINGVLCLPSEPLNHFSQRAPFEVFAPILSLLLSLPPSRPPTPNFSTPASFSLPLFSWSLHSTPPLQTAQKRAESATPDLWQTFQASRPFLLSQSPLSSLPLSLLSIATDGVTPNTNN